MRFIPLSSSSPKKADENDEEDMNENAIGCPAGSGKKLFLLIFLQSLSGTAAVVAEHSRESVNEHLNNHFVITHPRSRDGCPH